MKSAFGLISNNDYIICWVKCLQTKCYRLNEIVVFMFGLYCDVDWKKLAQFFTSLNIKYFCANHNFIMAIDFEFKILILV